MQNVTEKLKKELDELVERYPKLAVIQNDILNSYLVMQDAYSNKGKLLVAGNGGSAADADHIVGELMKGFNKKRKLDDVFIEKMKSIDMEKGTVLGNELQGALPAIALTNHTALNTAFLNDVDGLGCYAQQVLGFGNEEDVFLGISTSGNSLNVIYAMIVAKAKGMKTIALTGKDGGKLAKLADVSIIVPEQETYKIQELHLPIYHCWCLMLESKFF